MKTRLRKPRTLVVALLVALGLASLGGWLMARGRPKTARRTTSRQVHQAIRSGDWAAAESLLGHLSAAREKPSTLALLRAELEDARGRLEDSLATLNGIPDDDPMAPRARLLAGRINRKRDRARDAERALLEAIRLDPGQVEARREIVFLYGMQGRREALREQFATLSEAGLLDMNGAFLWTNVDEEILFNTANRPVLERFLAADPEDRFSRLALAEVLLQAGELDASEALLKALPDSDVESLSIRARLALKRSRIDDLRELLTRGPLDHPVLARLRGQLALQGRDLTGAARHFQIAVQLDPSNREAVQGLATALKSLGLDAEAKSHRTRAERLRALADLVKDQFRNLEIGTKDPTLPGRLGAACEAVGRLAEAGAWYRVALRIEPLNDEAQRGLSRVGIASDGR